MVRISWTAPKTGSILSRLFKSQEIQQAKLDRVIVSMGSTTESYHVGVQLWARAMGNRRAFSKLWGLIIICLNKSCQDETGLLLTMATLS